MDTRSPLPWGFRSPDVPIEQAIGRSFAAMCLAFLSVFSIALITHGLWRIVEKPHGALEDALGAYMASLFVGLPIAAILTVPVAALVASRLAGLLSVVTICVGVGVWIVAMAMTEPPNPGTWPMWAMATFLWPYPLLSWLFFWGSAKPRSTPVDRPTPD